MTLFDYSPGQQLDTSGGMRYVASVALWAKDRKA